MGINTLVSRSDGLGPSIFCRKMEKARPMREEMDRKLFISRQSRRFDFDVVICKVLFPFFRLTWRVNNYVSGQGKGIKRKNEGTDLEFSIITL